MQNKSSSNKLKLALGLALMGAATADKGADGRTNLIKNGDFENPTVGSWKLFPNGVEGWSGKGIEIGKGKNYNKNWPNGAQNQVAELDGDKNNYELGQKIQLEKGTYTLSLDCAARNGQALNTSEMEIVWNNQVIQKFAPKDYSINHLEMELPAIDGLNTLVLRGAGKVDGLGITVDNVELYQGGSSGNLEKVETVNKEIKTQGKASTEGDNNQNV